MEVKKTVDRGVSLQIKTLSVSITNENVLFVVSELRE